VLAIYKTIVDDESHYKLKMKGIIESDDGRLGPFTLNSAGFDSDVLKITKNQIHFPLSGSLILGNDDVTF
jgi:hypothetical protein